jgi:hypothetical protein
MYLFFFHFQQLPLEDSRVCYFGTEEIPRITPCKWVLRNPFAALQLLIFLVLLILLVFGSLRVLVILNLEGGRVSFQARPHGAAQLQLHWSATKQGARKSKHRLVYLIFRTESEKDQPSRRMDWDCTRISTYI